MLVVFAVAIVSWDRRGPLVWWMGLIADPSEWAYL
jgi:hypothetical protein